MLFTTDNVFSSSILVELRVSVSTMDDCLHRLDGRFNQLKTFVVTIQSIDALSSNIDNKVKSFFSANMLFNVFLRFPRMICLI